MVVDDPHVVLSTVLGSCVAACLRDPESGVGGMNHFLLPGTEDSRAYGEAERYGAHLMEVLVNGLLKRNARRERLEGKIFGGARMLRGLSDIGAKNAAFATRFLNNEGIRIVAENTGGTLGRRIEYFPVSGRARLFLLSDAAQMPPFQEPSAPRARESELELF